MIETARLLLRPFRPTDHDAVHAFGSDPEVVRYMDWGPNTPEDTAAFLAGVAITSTRLPLAVVERATDALIGSIELRIVAEADRRGEIGYVLNRGSWGAGYLTEAATALVQHGFAAFGLHKITATCDPRNTASANVLRKIGMRQEGHLRDHVLIRGQWQDRLYFGVLA